MLEKSATFQDLKTTPSWKLKKKKKSNTWKVSGFNFRQLTKTFTQHMHVSLLYGPRACSIVIYCETM